MPKKKLKPIRDQLEEAKEEIAELELLMQLRHSAERRAVALWRAVDPEKRAMWLPDRCNLVVFLLEQLDACNRPPDVPPPTKAEAESPKFNPLEIFGRLNGKVMSYRQLISELALIRIEYRAALPPYFTVSELFDLAQLNGWLKDQGQCFSVDLGADELKLRKASDVVGDISAVGPNASKPVTEKP